MPLSTKSSLSISRRKSSARQSVSSVKSSKSHDVLTQPINSTRPSADLSESEFYTLESESTAKLKGKKQKKSPEGIERLQQRLSGDYDSDDNSSSDVSLGTRQNTLREDLLSESVEMEPDFFDLLGSLPDLSAISLDISEEIVIESQGPKQEVAKQIDVDLQGRFVDPLTGGALEDENAESEPTVVEEEEQEEKKISEESVQESMPSFTEDDDLLRFVEECQKIETATEEKPVQAEQKMFETFLDTTTVKVVVDHELLREIALRRELEEQLRNIVDELVKNIIDNLVDRPKNSNVFRRQSVLDDLDNEKLWGDFTINITVLEVEIKVNMFIRKKLVTYWRRKRQMRSITEEKPEVAKINEALYKQSLAHLDTLLAQIQDTQEVSSASIDEAENELEEAGNMSKIAATTFDDFVKKAFKCERNEKMKEEVTLQLSKMEKMRKDIIKVREQLFSKQHEEAKILDQMKKTRNIGHGIKLEDFNRIRTEMETLEQSVEEDTAELTKLRSEYKEELERLSHYQQRLQMARHTLATQRQALKLIEENQEQAHAHLLELKTQRDKIRKVIRELSFQCGILDKPALAFDYDVSMVRLKAMREKCDALMQAYNQLQAEVDEEDAFGDE